MRTRLCYGLPLAAAILGLLWLDHILQVHHCFSALVAAASLLAWREYSSMVVPHQRGWRFAGYVAVALVLIIAYAEPYLSPE